MVANTDVRLFFLPLVAVVCCLAGTVAAQEQRPGKYLVRFQSDEPATVTAILVKQLQKRLSMAEVAVEHSATATAESDSRVFSVSFVESTGGTILLVLRSAAGGERSRVIPWLNAVGTPLADTLSRDETPALAILLENLLIEFATTELSNAPQFPGQRKPAAQPTPQEDTQTTDKDLQLAHLAWLGGGAAWIEPRLFQGRAVVGYALHIDDGGIFADVGFGFPATMHIDERGFAVWSLDAAAGARYLFWRGGESFLALEAAALWRYNSVKLKSGQGDEGTARGDGETHTWSDFGAGAFFFAYFGLADRLGIFLRTGPQLFFLYHRIQIDDEPRWRMNFVSVPVTAGLALSL